MFVTSSSVRTGMIRMPNELFRDQLWQCFLLAEEPQGGEMISLDSYLCDGRRFFFVMISGNRVTGSGT